MVEDAVELSLEVPGVRGEDALDEGGCLGPAEAVRRMLSGAKIAVDLFHGVQLAVKTTGDGRAT